MMQVNDVLNLLLISMVGILTGAIFFGGLWWTVRRGLESTRPALWFMVSMIVRMTIAVYGFYLVSKNGQWQGPFACLIGFLFARWMVTRLTHHSKGVLCT